MIRTVYWQLIDRSSNFSEMKEVIRIERVEWEGPDVTGETFFLSVIPDEKQKVPFFIFRMGSCLAGERGV